VSRATASNLSAASPVFLVTPRARRRQPSSPWEDEPMKRLTSLSVLAAALLAALGACATQSAADARPAERPDVAGVVRGNNHFAFDLYAKLAAKEGNQFFSPYSISTALAMTYVGARGLTAEEMARVLHFPADRGRTDRAFAALLAQTHGGKKEGYRLSVANALWGQKNYGFLPAFLNTTQTYYGAGLKEVDFGGATEQARRTINRWVEEKTNDKIKDLIQKGVLDANTRMVLTNAIYIKGSWASKFKKEMTHDEAFHVTAEKNVKVPMMHQTEEFKHADAEGFQALELPYHKGDLSMFIFLPKAVDGLAALEKKLSPAWLDQVRGRMRKQKVIVSLPKFKVTQAYGLKDVLSGMGMPTAFTPGKADFRGIVGSKEKVWISAVVHKAYADVNEEGTEAAAATAVVVKGRAFHPRPIFRADHPFVFLIRDNRSGSILFLGRLANPEG
jgi:serpin B